VDTEKTIDDATEIAQITPDNLIHQVRFRPIERTAYLKIDRGVTWFADRLKIPPQRREKPVANLIVERQLRFEMELPRERDRAIRREPDVRLQGPD